MRRIVHRIEHVASFFEIEHGCRSREFKVGPGGKNKLGERERDKKGGGIARVKGKQRGKEWRMEQ